MVIINSTKDFDDLLSKEKAVLFLNFKWSGYTAMASPFIYYWIEHSNLLKSKNIKVFEFFPEGDLEDYYEEWLTTYKKKQKNVLIQLRYHGYGDIVWFQNGEIKGGISLYTVLKNRKKNWFVKQLAKISSLINPDQKIKNEEYSLKYLDNKTIDFLK